MSRGRNSKPVLLGSILLLTLVFAPLHVIISPPGTASTIQESQRHFAPYRTHITAASASSVFGDGRDGDLVVRSGQTLYADNVRAAVVGTAAAGQKVVRINSASGFHVGDEVLIIQVQGTGAGNYEFATIASVTGNSPSVTLYEHPNFAGRAETFTGDDSCLTDNYIGNDTVSSIKVSPGTTAILYEHCDYGGVAETFTADDPDLGNNPIGHDRTSAIRIGGGHLVLQSDLGHTYTSDSGSRAQVIRVPQYRNVTIQSGGKLTVHAWDGNTGGVLVFRANGTVRVNGVIDASGRSGSSGSTDRCCGAVGGGFRGGGNSIDGSAAEWGESYAGTYGFGQEGRGPNYSGGGGADGWNRCGGGGGYATAGVSGWPNDGSGGYGYGGGTVGTTDLSRMYFGGGGGGGRGDNAGGGGSGGGIIYIIARHLDVSSGSLSAHGGDGGGVVIHPGQTSAGGAGAGGSIKLRVASATLGAGKVNATRGGVSGATEGQGGDGRIRIEYCDSISGSTNPPASVAKINFCYGTISGRVFRDNDGDGVQDAGEPGISGVTVRLSDGQTTTTNSNGDYSFTANAPANYTVSITPLSGYECATPCSVNTSVQVDQTTTVNFALRPSPTPTPTNTPTATPTPTSIPTSTPIPSPTPTATPSSSKPWAFMLYLDGDNDLYPHLDRAIRNLEAQSANPNVNILVLFDGDRRNDSWRFLVQTGGNYTIGINKWYMGELNMGDPQTLADFIDWTRQNYPAQHYYLAIADHGRGTTGVAWDDSSNRDYLSVRELQTALKIATNSGSYKIDVLHYDTCLMGMLENAYQVRQYASYLVASQNLGWSVFAYDQYVQARGAGVQGIADLYTFARVVPQVTADTTPKELAVSIANAYFNHPALVERNYPRTISVLDLSQAGAVKDALNELVTALQSNLSAYKTYIQNTRSGTQRFDSRDYYKITDEDEYLDLYDFARRIKQNISNSTVQDAAQGVMDAIANGFVVTESHHSGTFNLGSTEVYWDLDGSHGVSIYFPSASGGYGYSDYVNDVLYSFTADSQWDEFLVDYFGVMGLPPENPVDPGLPAMLAPEFRVYLPLVLKDR